MKSKNVTDQKNRVKEVEKGESYEEVTTGDALPIVRENRGKNSRPENCHYLGIGCGR